LIRRQSRRRRRILRPRRRGSQITRRQVRFRDLDGRVFAFTANLRPGEYEVYRVDSSVEKRTLNLGIAGRVIKTINRTVLILETLVQTKNFINRQTGITTIYKPIIPPTLPSAGESGPACVEIACPPQFPANATCWRCIEAIQAPSEGEEGAGAVFRRITGVRVLPIPPRRIPRRGEVEEVPTGVPRPRFRPLPIPTPPQPGSAAPGRPPAELNPQSEPPGRGPSIIFGPGGITIAPTGEELTEEEEEEEEESFENENNFLNEVLREEFAKTYTKLY